jgi:hypothetical protein
MRNIKNKETPKEPFYDDCELHPEKYPINFEAANKITDQIAAVLFGPKENEKEK